MKQFRLTTAWLMAVVLIIAIGAAALTRPSALWGSALFTAALGLLCTATALALVRHPSRRAFWVGFAVFGWPYFALAFPWHQPNGINPPRLLSSTLLLGLPPHGEAIGRFVMVELQNYEPVGQSLATVVFALLGATLTWFLTARSGQPQP
jgi:hypothetical protein